VSGSGLRVEGVSFRVYCLKYLASPVDDVCS